MAVMGTYINTALEAISTAVLIIMLIQAVEVVPEVMTQLAIIVLVAERLIQGQQYILPFLLNIVDPHILVGA